VDSPVYEDERQQDESTPLPPNDRRQYQPLNHPPLTPATSILAEEVKSASTVSAQTTQKEIERQSKMIPPLPPPVTEPAPLRPSKSLRSSSTRSTNEYFSESSSMPRSRAISDLSRGMNGETTNYLMDDYSNGIYFHEPRFEEDEEEDEGHLLIEFGKGRKSRQEAENLAKQLQNAS
jgi:hypothetical protein